MERCDPWDGKDAEHKDEPARNPGCVLQVVSAMEIVYINTEGADVNPDWNTMIFFFDQNNLYKNDLHDLPTEFQILEK